MLRLDCRWSRCVVEPQNDECLRGFHWVSPVLLSWVARAVGSDRAPRRRSMARRSALAMAPLLSCFLHAHVTTGRPRARLRECRAHSPSRGGRRAALLGADGASATALRPRPRRITQSGVSRFPGTTPAMRPPDRLGGRAARGPLPSGTPSTQIRGAGRRTRGPRIRPGGAASPPGGP